MTQPTSSEIINIDVQTGYGDSAPAEQALPTSLSEDEIAAAGLSAMMSGYAPKTTTPSNNL